MQLVLFAVVLIAFVALAEVSGHNFGYTAVNFVGVHDGDAAGPEPEAFAGIVPVSAAGGSCFFVQ